MTPSLSRIIRLQFCWVGTYALSMFLVPTWVESGMAPATAMQWMSVLPLGLLLCGPTWAWLADRHIGRQRALVLSATMASVAGVALLAPPPIAPVALVMFAIARAPIAPMIDAASLHALGGDNAHYGTLRAWGSMAFIGVALIQGVIRDVLPGTLWMIPCVVLMAVTAWDTRKLDAPAPQAGGGSLLQLLQTPGLVSLLLIGMLQGMTLSHHDLLFSMKVSEAGLSNQVVSWGALLGVGCEVVLMRNASLWLNRWGAGSMLVVATWAGPLRWWVISQTTDPTWLIAIQALHGLSFGAFWIASVALVAQAAPPSLTNSTQALLPAATFGVGTLASMQLSSHLWPVLGPDGLYACMAVIAVTAALGATVRHLVVAVRARRASRYTALPNATNHE